MRRSLCVAVLSTAVMTTVVTGALSPVQAVTKPAQVTGVKFANQDWANRSLKISWGAVSGATTYVVKRSTSSNLSNPVYKDVTVNGAWISPLNPGTDYYFAVAAKKGTTAGIWSSTFKTRLRANAVSVFPSGTKLTPKTNGVTLSWPAVSNASDYRYRWSAGPNPNRTPDRWTQHVAGWSSAFDPATRSATISGTDADLTKVAYGNPIYARAEARDIYFNDSYVRQSAQVVGWPLPTAPNSSDMTVRFGSYNVMCSGCETAGQAKWPSRGPAVASNIARKNLDVVTVVEASGDADANASNGNQQVYQDLDRRLSNLELTDASTVTNTSDPGNRILYNPDKYDIVAKGTLAGIHDYRGSGQDLYTPWATLRAKTGSRATFMVVAAHYGIPTTSIATTRKTQLGVNSKELVQALTNVNAANLPVIIGADLNDSRYPEGRTDGAQPTLIRAGFYDSSASQHRYGTTKPTYNNYESPAKQVADNNGDGQRIDYILTKGFKGSDEFTNEWNPGGSVIPSDHNMITTVLHVP
jgi:hypothetical protein